jgi:hypothetical protein
LKGDEAMKTNPEFSEENLYPLWDNFCRSHSWSDDLRLQGIHAGELNLFEGPDYQGADFELDGKVYHGDVEIHRYTNDWFNHHHHLDRRYNSVQLHLVWHVEPSQSVFTSNNREIFTFDMKKLIRLTKVSYPKNGCKITQIEPDAFSKQLKQLSLKRLLYKTIRVKNLVKCHSYDQVIFMLLMRILGSPNNSTNFELLASSLPWEEIINIKNKNNRSQEEWMFFLLSMCGLKSKQISSIKFSNFVTKHFISKAAPLSKSNWQLAGQRPNNHPTEHIKNLASWIYAIKYDSLYFRLKDIISQRQSMNSLLISIEAVFSGSDSMKKQDQKGTYTRLYKSLWGRSKIIEIVGNVILPFFTWEASTNSSHGFLEYLQDIYYSLPQSTRYARLKKFEKFPVMQNNTMRKFHSSQGLLFIDRQYCKTNRCSQCPVMSVYKDVDKNFRNI